jgi:hypothetical protein
MKSNMFQDFIQAPLHTQLLWDFFLPPPLAAFCWLVAKLRFFFRMTSLTGLSSRDVKYLLGGTYLLMLGLTIYSRFSR